MTTANSQLALTLRALGAHHITLGQSYIQTAEQHEANMAAGASAPVTAHIAPPPAAAPAPGAAPFPPPAAAAPIAVIPPAPGAAADTAAPELGADGKPKRVRRTKAQIEADEAAIKAGFTSHADMLAKTGGTQQAPVPPAPVAPGATPVPPMPAVQQQSPVPPAPVANVAPPPPPAAPAFAGPSLEDVTASLLGMVQCVETAGWVGHGEGQAATLLQKLNFQNVHTIPETSRDTVIQWVNHFKTEFMAGRLPLGAATAGFIS